MKKVQCFCVVAHLVELHEGVDLHAGPPLGVVAAHPQGVLEVQRRGRRGRGGGRRTVAVPVIGQREGSC